ncbi:hypothetical protein B0H21DRAFT_549796 [Amylocystis lapponica]|nr:hypothetical protein B0H21DRAFT_549796 [Amylocystis lapponica]
MGGQCSGGCLPGMKITHTRPGVDLNWQTQEEFEDCRALWREFWLAECSEEKNTDFKDDLGMNPVNPPFVAGHDNRRTAQSDQRCSAHEPVYTDPRECCGSTSRLSSCSRTATSTTQHRDVEAMWPRGSEAYHNIVHMSMYPLSSFLSFFVECFVVGQFPSMQYVILSVQGVRSSRFHRPDGSALSDKHLQMF